MDERIILRRRIIIAISVFIALIAIVSLIALINRKPNAIPSGISNLPTTPVVPEDISTVYGIDSLVNTTLSTLQVTLLEQELDIFVTTYAGEELTNVTIEKPSVLITYNAADASSEIRFIITTNTGSRYLVVGKYVYVNDMYVRIYPEAGGEPVYQQAYDRDLE